MKILAYTVRNIRGRMGEAAMDHFCILKEYGNSFDHLTTDKTDGSKKVIKKYIDMDIDKVVNQYTLDFLENYRSYKDWYEVYDKLDVSEFKDYDLLYIAGGLFFPSSGICETGRHRGKFPDKQPLTFLSHATKIVNMMVLLKIHNEYGVPLHELARDPDELNCYQFNPKIAPKLNDNYYLYHGYDYPVNNMHRLDTVQSRIRHVERPRDQTKLYNMTFGYTCKEDDRSVYVKEFEEFAKDIDNKNIFCRKIGDDSVPDTFQKRDDYLNLIAQSRYTYMLPAYWDDFMSVFRLIESIDLYCLPILSDHCRVDEINESFGIDLNKLKISSLKTLPSEEKRLELLEELREKIIFGDKVLFKGIDVPELDKSVDSDLDDW